MNDPGEDRQKHNEKQDCKSGPITTRPTFSMGSSCAMDYENAFHLPDINIIANSAPIGCHRMGIARFCEARDDAAASNSGMLPFGLRIRGKGYQAEAVNLTAEYIDSAE